jgi:thymidylate kinase
MRYVVFEGLPAAGKSEVLELLARFYPERLRVFPEIVKEVATREGIDLFAERNRLTQAILAALPRRREEIEEALALGELCLEESHLGVHFAY